MCISFYILELSIQIANLILPTPFYVIDLPSHFKNAESKITVKEREKTIKPLQELKYRLESRSVF